MSYIKDIDIRNTLKEDVLKKYIDDQNSRVVEEMGISQDTMALWRKLITEEPAISG